MGTFSHNPKEKSSTINIFLSLSSLVVLLMIRSGVATVERQVTFLIFPLLKKISSTYIVATDEAYLIFVIFGTLPHYLGL